MAKIIYLHRATVVADDPAPTVRRYPRTAVGVDAAWPRDPQYANAFHVEQRAPWYVRILNVLDDDTWFAAKWFLIAVITCWLIVMAAIFH